MAIGTTAAILGSAVLGAGASIAGSKSNSKAINQATDASTAAARENNALTREIYNTNRGILSPFVNSGVAANGAINSLLGIPSNNAGTATVGSLYAPANDTGYYGGFGGTGGGALQLDAPLTGGYGGDGYSWAPQIDGYQQPQTAAQGQPAPQQSNYQQAFDNYRNSTGYQFRVNEGQKALGAKWLAQGLGRSGAAAKSAMTFGQGIASDEFANYLAQLGQQQNVGLGAGSALAGVGQNFANTVSANNNQAASAIANGALARASNNNAMWGNIAGIAGQAAGALSSYGRPGAYGIAGSGGIY